MVNFNKRVINYLLNRELRNQSVFGASKRRDAVIPKRLRPIAGLIDRLGYVGILLCHLWYVAARPNKINDVFFYRDSIVVADFQSGCIRRAFIEYDDDYEDGSIEDCQSRVPARQFFTLPNLARAARLAGLMPRECGLVLKFTFAACMYWEIYYRFFLSRIQPKALVLYDDIAPKVIGLALAASARGIPIALFRMSDGPSRPMPCFSIDMAFCWNKAQHIELNDLRLGVVHIPRVRQRMRFLKPSASIHVGIVLNAFFELHAVKYLARDLARRPNVTTVEIRPHPRTDPRLLDSADEYCSVAYDEPITQFIDKIDLAICGNSTVVPELLQNGLPVVYTDRLECLPPDLNGYWKLGLVPALEDMQLDADLINAFYSADRWSELIDRRTEFASDAISVTKGLRRLAM